MKPKQDGPATERGAHGGRRENQPGRPPIRGERKQTLALRVSPTLRAFLDESLIEAGGTSSLSEMVEDIVRSSLQFKTWNRKRRS